MSKKPETVFKERIWPELLAIPNSWWEKIQQVGKRGTPDYLGCINGMFVALELKATDKDKPDPLQLYKMNKIEECKGRAYCVRPSNWNEIKIKLLQLSREKRVSKRCLQ